jgi:hypothetical protein
MQRPSAGDDFGITFWIRLRFEKFWTFFGDFRMRPQNNFVQYRMRPNDHRDRGSGPDSRQMRIDSGLFSMFTSTRRIRLRCGRCSNSRNNFETFWMPSQTERSSDRCRPKSSSHSRTIRSGHKASASEIVGTFDVGNSKTKNNRNPNNPNGNKPKHFDFDVSNNTKNHFDHKSTNDFKNFA